VADGLGAAGLHGRRGIVAVAADGRAAGVGRAIQRQPVEEHGRTVVVVVRVRVAHVLRIAVLVDPVAGRLAGTGLDRGVRVVAVAAHGRAAGVGRAIQRQTVELHRRAVVVVVGVGVAHVVVVAVLVDAVADGLGARGLDRGARVVAVAADGRAAGVGRTRQ